MALVALNKTLIFMIMIIVGVICRKIGFLTDERSKGISDLLLNVSVPALVISSLQMDYDPSKLRGILFSYLLSIAGHALFTVVAFLIHRKNDKYDYLVARFTCIYSNAGFMGLPLSEMIFGPESIIYAATHIMTMNIFMFSHGIWFMGGGKERFQIRNFFSPVMISVFIGMVMFFTSFKLPGIVSDSAEMLAATSAPLGMLVVGNSIAKVDFRHSLNKAHVLLITLEGLLLFPLLGVLLCAIIPGDLFVKMIAIVAFACPSANLGLIFAIKYGRDELLASEIISLSSILSIATIPLIIRIAEMVVH